ncbi:protein phosphatase 2C domain-containing protein [Kitasatospora phosalacinea]|uniref:protein phosphatase 2C domain-containing protein n=1 Tax=Kitasatospora phosalacinea TaxID=2065 RepID=UPI003651CD75
MQISYTCQPSPDVQANEDFILAAERFVIVLDGATASGLPSGCEHSVSWLAGRLGGQLACVLIENPGLDLTEVLREGIVRTRGLHAQCDLTNPNSPSSTVAIVREHNGRLDCLTLADSPIVVRTRGGEVTAVFDDRTSHLPAYDRDSLSILRNTDEGFWVASTKPEAADRAVTASFPLADVESFGMVTDGVSRLVERYGWTWERLLDTLAKQGPEQAVQAIRDAELATEPGTFRGKRHDDVTAVYGQPEPGGE